MNAIPSPTPSWWREARFGLFIHWGVYSVPAGVHRGRNIAGASEWLMQSARISVAEYKSFAAGFTAARYHPQEWVRLARECGMGYVIIGAKHHDGFALFETELTDWNAKDATPAGRDVLRPLVEACREAVLPIGFYYSQAQDWTNGGATYAGNWDPAQNRDFDDYLNHFAIPQIRELLTNYGPDVPACLWWDTPAGMTPERAARVNAVVQELAPGILQNDRLGPGFLGGFETPEQRIPANRPARPWETCMTTNESWGYNRHDHEWKAPGLLIRQLCEVVSQGGNYLLNVGPKADGTIPDETAQILREIGRWFARHGEAIRGASAGPMPYRMPWGCTTARGNTVYLCVDTWPDDRLIFVPLQDQPTSIAWVSTGRSKVAVDRPSSPDGFFLRLPEEAPDAYVSVIALHFEAPPRLGLMPERARPPIVPQPVDGSLALLPADCEIIGDHLALLSGSPSQLGCWTSLDSHPLWRVHFHRGGRYRVDLEYALPAHREGTLAEIQVGGSSTNFVVAGTGGWGEFVRTAAGSVEVSAGPEVAVRVLPKDIPVGAVMNLRALYLTPSS